MPQGIILEFGTGIAGYAILVPYQQERRRNAMNVMMNPPDPRIPKVRQKGEKIYIPRVGSGHVTIPHPRMPTVKIGDMVPFKFPNAGLQDPPPRWKTPTSASPRRYRFDFTENSGGNWLAS